MKNNFEDKLEALKRNSGTEDPLLLHAQKVLFSYPNSTLFVELPSKGLFYPKDHPLYSQDKVEIREMTAKEEDILTNKSYIRNGVLVDKLLESLLIDKNIPVDTILVGDKNAIMIEARMNAYGSNYDVSADCTECGGRNTVEVDLSQAKRKETHELLKQASPDVIKQSDNGNLIIKLPKTKWIVECRIMNGVDEKKILKIFDSKRNIGETPELTIIEQLSLIIESINYSNDQEILKQAIESMPAHDAKYLRDIYQKYAPGITVEKHYECSFCSEKQELEVPFTQEFFWPKSGV